MVKKINAWDLWEKEWWNAYHFFNSKGNIKTRARLKKKWHDEFMKMVIELAGGKLK